MNTDTSPNVFDPTPAAKKWLQRIKNAITFRDATPSTKRWDVIEKYYAHENMGIESVGDEFFITPAYNMVYMFGRALIPSIIFQAPQVTNTARRREFIPHASVLDSIDNWLVQEMEVDDIFREAVLNSYLFNMGFVQLGWDTPQALDLSKEKDPITKAASLAYGFERIPKCINRSRRYNFPWLDVVDPRRLIFAPGTKNLRTCHWYARVCCDRTESLSAYLKKSVKSTNIPTEYRSVDEGSTDYPEEWTVYYQIHDQLEKKWCMLSIDGEFILDWQDDSLQVDGLPGEAIIFNQMPRTIWGASDAIYIEGQMLDGNDCRFQGLKQRRVSLVKALMDEGAISKEEAEKLYNDDALPIIRVKPTGSKPLSEAVVLLQPHVQQEFWGYQEKLQEDAQRVLGFGPNQLGNFASGRRTRYEVQVVEDRNLSRTNERREMVGNAIANIMRKVNQLVVKNWRRPLVMRVIGADLAQYWVEVSPGSFEEKMLSDEIATTVDVASMGPQSAERVKQEAMQILQMIGSVPGVNIYPIVRQLLSKFPWLDVEAVLPMQNAENNPMPMQQFQQNQMDLMKNDSQLREQQRSNLTSAQPLLLGSSTPAKPKTKVKGKANA